MGSEEARTIGQWVLMIRHHRGLGLKVAADLAGISKPYLSQLENGLRGFNRRGLLEELAAALGCSVTDLAGQPYHLPDRDTEATFAAVSAIQLALNDYGPDDAPDINPRPLAQLTLQANSANEYCAQARYSTASKGSVRC